MPQGIREVVVQKESIEGPRDYSWTTSQINNLYRGAVVSYWKGLYQVHETATEWRDQWDRYYLREKTVFHHLDDALLPLVLSGTVFALLTDARKGSNTTVIPEQQKHG